MKFAITQYDTTHQGKFEPAWYADVWASDTTLKFQVLGMPFNSAFHMDRKAIPQLICILQRIQNDAKIHS